MRYRLWLGGAKRLEEDRLYGQLVQAQGLQIIGEAGHYNGLSKAIGWQVELGDTAIMGALKPWLDEEELDILWVPEGHRGIRLLISDMDSTMIGQECIDEMADMLGLKDKVAAITESAMWGELDFDQALAARLSLLKGLDMAVIETIWCERISLNVGARELLESAAKHGVRRVLVSGGFDVFTSRVAEALGFEEHHANRLEQLDGRMTGRAIPPILGADAKRERLMRICDEKGIKPHQILAIGDGANDLPMLAAAGFGVAYRAKPKVQQACDIRLNYAYLDFLSLLIDDFA